MAASETSLKSLRSSSELDTNQLVALCQRIRDTVNLVEQRISLTRLHIVTLSYVIKNFKTPDSGHAMKLSDNLIKLSNFSQLIVQLLDELHSRLRDNQDFESVNSQIASQQLVFFTSEWYDNLGPKLREIFQMAELIIDPKINESQKINGTGTRMGGKGSGSQHGGPTEMDSDRAMNDALLRLRQSMNENERLIRTISANIEYTRATIESIYDSLQSTKIGLNKSEQNAIKARDVLRNTNRCLISLIICITIPLIILIIYAIRFVVSLFS